MADEMEEHSKMERHSSNDSRLLHFYEVNQQHCNNDKASNDEIVYEARLENVDNFEDDSESSNSDNELDEQEQPKVNSHTPSTHTCTSNTKNDTMSVIEDMKGFMVTEEKAGPKINDELASVVNDGLRKKAKQNKVDELTKKYAKARKCIWSQMSVPNRMNDVKLQKIQNLLGKKACPMLYLMDLFLSKSQTNDGLSRENTSYWTENTDFTLCRLDFMKITKDNVIIEINEILKTSKPGKHLSPISLPAFVEDSRLCIVTVLNAYIERTSAIIASQKLFVTFVKPYHHPTKSTISNWIKLVLKLAGVNTSIFKTHSTRGASTSAALKAGVSVNSILKSAGWTNESTFRQFYNRPVTVQEYNEIVYEYFGK
ncbi:unnamed protein product [Mytilus coruscus]|uniref:Tyr recombinase domain-containing protein n=1 Tax=Mytilus coruscus TaxID=42192 RepID=A0A6J8BEJ5_MYTCO|nr:unnamed protein product [Mytilus coruscus]